MLVRSKVLKLREVTMMSGRVSVQEKDFYESSKRSKNPKILSHLKSKIKNNKNQVEFGRAVRFQKNKLKT